MRDGMACDTCSLGGYHGFPPKNAPAWAVGTIYWWCPVHETHGKRLECMERVEGEPGRFDKRGNPV